MIRLPSINKELETEFYDDTAKKYAKFLEKTRVLFSVKPFSKAADEFNEIYDFFKCKAGGKLDENKIKNIIVGSVDFLTKMIDEIGIIKSKEIKDLFCGLYTNFAGRDLAKALPEKMGIRTCPYCNRSYIFTLKDKGIRPQYDHFFPISKYPYLAVSLYNLIPSCGICNLAKRDVDTYEPTTKHITFIYPHQDEYGYDAFFETKYSGDFKYWLGASENFELEINTKNALPLLQKRIGNAKDKLRINDLYNKHKDYISDIIKQCNIYSDTYVEDLLKSFPALFGSEEEVQNLVFMNYLQKEKWGDRILSKLTYDIRKEFL